MLFGTAVQSPVGDRLFGAGLSAEVAQMIDLLLLLAYKQPVRTNFSLCKSAPFTQDKATLTACFDGRTS
jgi:hypothetical protein